jgi:hypothetical protein
MCPRPPEGSLPLDSYRCRFHWCRCPNRTRWPDQSTRRPGEGPYFLGQTYIRSSRLVVIIKVFTTHLIIGLESHISEIGRKGRNYKTNSPNPFENNHIAIRSRRLLRAGRPGRRNSTCKIECPIGLVLDHRETGFGPATPAAVH